MDIFLYVAWIAFLIVGLVIRYEQRKKFRESHTGGPLILDKATFESLNNPAKSSLFAKGDLIRTEQYGTLTSTLKNVHSLLVECKMINGKVNGFWVHENMEAYEASRPTSDPVDVEELEEDYYRWLSKEATQEDLREIFGEPKPLSEEEKKKREEEWKSRSFDEPLDDLPF